MRNTSEATESIRHKKPVPCMCFAWNWLCLFDYIEITSSNVAQGLRRGWTSNTPLCPTAESFFTPKINPAKRAKRAPLGRRSLDRGGLGKKSILDAGRQRSAFARPSPPGLQGSLRLVSTSLQAGACISPAGAERLPAGLWPEDILLNTEMSERRGRRRNSIRALCSLGHIQR